MKIPSTLLRGTGSLQRVLALALIAGLLLTMLFPMPIRGQFGLGLVGLVRALQAIYDILRDEIGKVLGEITTLTQWFKDYFELVLFPKGAIEAVRAFVSQMQNYFVELIGQVLRFPVSSATLPAPQELEGLTRAGSLDFNQLAVAYSSVYGAVPSAVDASPLDRDLIDVGDAMSLNSLKSLSAYEATVSVSLKAASAIENRIRNPASAPGAAPFLSAAGILASVQTQAMIQRMIASQLRQEAAILAHRNTLLKRDVALAGQMRKHIGDLVRER